MPAASKKTTRKPVRKTAVASKKTPSVAAKKASAAGGGSKSLKTFLDDSVGAKQRALALSDMNLDIVADRDSFNSVIAVVKDKQVDSKLRQSALATLQAATFDPQKFAPYRTTYRSTLRALRRDPDMELRKRAFGLLAREQDEDTQALLLEGLKDSEKALLPPEKALQLLSYQPHAGAYEVAREIEKSPPNAVARREALRVLAADSASAPLFERVLLDKGESTEIRQLAAGALQHLAPKRMQAVARDIAVDEGDSDEVKTFCLTALTNFGDPGVLAADATLQQQVEGIQGRQGEGVLKHAAAKFKRVYG